jgi:hypothetical protein
MGKKAAYQVPASRILQGDRYPAINNTGNGFHVSKLLTSRSVLFAPTNNITDDRPIKTTVTNLDNGWEKAHGLTPTLFKMSPRAEVER